MAVEYDSIHLSKVAIAYDHLRSMVPHVVGKPARKHNIKKVAAEKPNVEPVPKAVLEALTDGKKKMSNEERKARKKARRQAAKQDVHGQVTGNNVTP